MKNVMTMVDRLVRKNKVRADLLCFYHDELNFEVHPDDAGKMSKILVHSFEKVGESLELVCPMATEPKTGNTWYDIH
jgi:DNA polymerase I-like protein with 3'-5' exonuclease and polymerase domains